MIVNVKYLHLGGEACALASFVDVTEYKRAEATHRTREARLSSEAMQLFSLDADGTLRLVATKRAYIERFGRVKPVDETDTLGLTFEQIALDVYERPPEMLAHWQASLRHTIDHRVPVAFEHALGFRDGTITAEVMRVLLLDAAAARVQILWSSRDVTASRLADAQTRAVLAEKTLLRAIHYRVKNNLQVIASLLHLRAKKFRSPADLRQRIFAMTLVHERLSQARDVGRIDFGDYVRALVLSLKRWPGIRIETTSDGGAHVRISFRAPGQGAGA